MRGRRESYNPNSATLLRIWISQVGISLAETIVGAVHEEGGRTAVLGSVLHVDGKGL